MFSSFARIGSIVARAATPHKPHLAHVRPRKVEALCEAVLLGK
jgi:hypothetical protein